MVAVVGWPPEISAGLEGQLGEGESPRLTFEVDAHSHSPVLLFHYPTTQPPALDYLKRSVKLEFGSLTEQRPTASHAVRPWIADVLPEAFGAWQRDVVTQVSFKSARTSLSRTNKWYGSLGAGMKPNRS